MRVMTCSAAAIVLVAAGITIFWPARNAAPGVAQVVAQDPAGNPEAPGGNQPADPTAAKPADKTLADKLNERIDGEFVETPLHDVLANLKDKTGIQFYMKLKKLEEHGINVDTPVTKNLQQVRLSTLLDLMLDELDLVWVERDELILITTAEDAQATMEVRVYDCRDLLELAKVGPILPGGIPAVPGTPSSGRSGGFFGAAPGQAPAREILPQAVGGFGGAPGAEGGDVGGGLGGPVGGGGAGIVTEHDLRVDPLIDVITTAVDPDSWNDVGGPGSISEFAGLIVINQSSRTHKKVERVLDMLRQAAGLEVPKSGKVVR